MTKFCRWLGVALGMALLGPVAAGQTSDEGVTLSGDAFLKVPAGVGEVAVAKTPPTVYVRLFKDLPDGGKGTLWSGWGDGCLASNGKYYTAIGDHLDIHGGTGQSRLYEFDPAAKSLKMVVNTREVIPDAKLAGGKVHARLEEAADGWLYYASYWGKVPKDADWDAGFRGSALLRFDPRTGKAECLGVPVPKQGLPTSRMDAKRGVIYFLAVYSGDLVVYDIAARQVKYRASGDVQEGNRNIILDADGNAYFSTKDGTLARYRPDTRDVEATKAKLPASAREPPPSDEGASSGKARSSRETKKGVPTLRSSTVPARSGIVYGMTHAGMMFAFDPKAETIRDLGPNFGTGDYTAVVLLSPDEKYLYYAPGSHGSDVRHGAALVQFEIATGRRKVLAFLLPPIRERLKYTLGGTFNLKITADGGTLIGTFNGAPYDPAARKEVAFGQPALLVIEIPKSERE